MHKTKPQKSIANLLRRLMPEARHASRALSVTLVLALVCQPTANAASKSVIWESGDQIVQIAGQDNDSAPPNDHPSNTTSDEIAAMLGMLKLRYTDKASDTAPTTVFTQQEIDDLSAAVAIGLQRASPAQDILFHVMGSRRLSRVALARRNRVSAGRIFIRNGNLNIIFGQIQTAYRKKNVYGQTDQDFYPRNYGSREKAAKQKVLLQTNAAIRFHQGSADEIRNDWLVINPGIKIVTERSDPVLQPPSPTASTADEVMPGTGSKPAPAAPTAEQPAGPGSVVQPSANTSKQALTPSATIPPTPDVEARLEKLKRLRDRQLISEDAYQAKVKEILQDL